jgi:hypothetical protein
MWLRNPPPTNSSMVVADVKASDMDEAYTSINTPKIKVCFLDWHSICAASHTCDSLWLGLRAFGTGEMAWAFSSETVTLATLFPVDLLSY